MVKEGYALHARNHQFSSVAIAVSVYRSVVTAPLRPTRRTRCRDRQLMALVTSCILVDRIWVMMDPVDRV